MRSHALSLAPIQMGRGPGDAQGLPSAVVLSPGAMSHS